MDSHIVVYDACVLYPAPLRDLLMHLALTGLFQAKWTEAIHEEWMRNVLANRPDLTRTQLERTRDLMNLHAIDCLVEDYENYIDELQLPDPNDRHILAAAIHCSASAIITFNLKDFPCEVTRKHGLKAQHPDEFVSELLKFSPMKVCTAISRLRANLKKPPIDVLEYLAILEAQGLTMTVKILREFAGLL